MSEKYEPTAVDIAFAKQMTSLIADGGAWAAPGALLIYTFDKVDNVMTCTTPENIPRTNVRVAAHTEKEGSK